MVRKVLASRIGVLVAVALAALAAIGAGKLVSDHRKARLDEAFRALAIGLERLNADDAAAAQAQFAKSIDEMRAVGRDPLIALHHAFAARLRTQAADAREVRELMLPSMRQGETLLALALADDSSLLALTTTQRLLCLRLEDTRWSQWDLPQNIERVGALHIDAETGQAFLVVGDDGKLSSANCRTGEGLLVASRTLAEDRKVVAWVDAAARTAWIAPAEPVGPEVEIAARPLPGARGEPLELRASFPGEANSIFGTAAVVHAIAKIGDNVLLFYGDANVLHDSDLRDESVLVVAIDEPERQTNRLVFPASAAKEPGGKARWMSTHVRRLLPASMPGRVYALTEEPAGVAVLGPDAKPIEVHHDSLFATEYRDGRERYDLSVRSSGGVAALEVTRRGTDTRVDYQLPWRFERPPRLATISREGRRIVLADETGAILLVDLGRE
ncbi:MAG TPA: hypothetical protein VG994_14060 [Steroidobacteraceae bacterium]|nr:hypothetical protein [Steroidobacteraceae bacterium]